LVDSYFDFGQLLIVEMYILLMEEIVFLIFAGSGLFKLGIPGMIKKTNVDVWLYFMIGESAMI
jgi:hypothetical protein